LVTDSLRSQLAPDASIFMPQPAVVVNQTGLPDALQNARGATDPLMNTVDLGAADPLSTVAPGADAKDYRNSILLNDGSTCCGRPAPLGSPLAGLNPIEATPLSHDNYDTGVVDKLKLDPDANHDGTPNQTITVTFALFSDDGSQLHIEGQD